MATSTAETCDVRTVGEALESDPALANGNPDPMAFLWRARLYIVRNILDRTETTWRVQASTGRAYGAGTYELERTAGGWTVRQCLD
ncbi:hypothetical protein KIH74_22635 [Kineosporia sp. J2-2]|uniref:DUF6504 domain-containing protein n=1 Tax=Kineosporia corallincola TaxID=2835133 RepID=A0ABS5TKX5_9ACTN|nr:DUF6504 family protein [Kineosporia corallincola]MBT0771755.1 hypothetical protein [Kineosporia corallincola]